jgi:putative flippase GtrA
MIKKEFYIFLLIGSLTTLVDYLTYLGIIKIGPIDIKHAKGIGFITGAIFSYFANRIWTFSIRSHSLKNIWRFAALYFLTFVANIYINSGILNILNSHQSSVPIAFLIATGFSAVLNFLGMKFFVFNQRVS